MQLEFASWKPGSEQYANIDAEMKVRLTTLYFYLHRPTIGALMGIGTDLGDAFRSPDFAQSGTQTEGDVQQEEDQLAAEDDRDESSDDASGEKSNLGSHGLCSAPCHSKVSITPLHLERCRHISLLSLLSGSIKATIEHCNLAPEVSLIAKVELIEDLILY